MCVCEITCLQHEAKAERQEERLHARAVNAALHGHIGQAIRLEVRALGRSGMRNHVPRLQHKAEQKHIEAERAAVRADLAHHHHHHHHVRFLTCL